MSFESHLHGVTVSSAGQIFRKINLREFHGVENLILNRDKRNSCWKESEGPFDLINYLISLGKYKGKVQKTI